MDAVAAHRDAAAHRRQGLAVAVLEAGGDAVGILGHAGAAGVDHYAVFAQALAHGRQQRHLQIAAVDGVLRPVVARVETRGLAVDELAVARIENGLAGAHGDGVQRGQQPQFVELAGGVGQQVDPDAQRPDFTHAFVDAAGDARLVQAQRQHQAADAGAHDDHIGLSFHAHTIRTLSVPRPSTPPTILSPRTTGPTPSGVPV